MSALAPKASLTTLPSELIRLIVEDVIEYRRFRVGLQPELQPLSLMSRRLRECVLPFMWASVEVDSVKKLGELRERFKLNPSLALYVKDFTFKWRMVEDWYVRSVQRPLGGPDGKGMDERIWDVEQLKDCVVTVISKSTSLQKFRWESDMRMPAGAVAALAKLKGLTSFYLSMSRRDRILNDLPFWKISCLNLESLDVMLDDEPGRLSHSPDVEEQFEDNFTSLPAPIARRHVVRRDNKDEYHLNVASRTTVPPCLGFPLCTTYVSLRSQLAGLF